MPCQRDHDCRALERRGSAVQYDTKELAGQDRQTLGKKERKKAAPYSSTVVVIFLFLFYFFQHQNEKVEDIFFFTYTFSSLFPTQGAAQR